MNWVHIHLMTNHAPIIGVLVGLAILAFGVFRNSKDLKRFALGYFVVLGAVTVLVYLTGEPAEEAIEHAAGISENTIEAHEDASIYGLIAVLLLSLLSLAALIFRKKRLEDRPWFCRLLLGVALVASLIMAWVANLGGKIRHTEINPTPELNQAETEENDD